MFLVYYSLQLSTIFHKRKLVLMLVQKRYYLCYMNDEFGAIKGCTTETLDGNIIIYINQSKYDNTTLQECLNKFLFWIWTRRHYVPWWGIEVIVFLHLDQQWQWQKTIFGYYLCFNIDKMPLTLLWLEKDFYNWIPYTSALANSTSANC